MIRINLLGQARPKNKRAAASAAAVMEMGEVGSPKLKVLLVLMLAGSLNVMYWYRLDKEKQHIAAQMQVAEQRNRELADVKARYLERQRQAESYKRRVDVIDQLRASQSGPVNLLNTIGDTINGTEAVWLNTMKDQGGSVDIEGIEIKETYQDESFKEMQAFQFVLTCEKAKS
jgi:Tfp pilus assembly protein PilN